MKKLNIIFAALITTAFSLTVHSQGVSYSKMLKNVNSDAVDMYHDLNASKDSLNISHTDEKVLRVQFISHKAKDKKKYDFGKQRVSVPLAKLGVGRYTVAVYLTNGQVVVFGLVRLLPIPTKELEKDPEDLRIAKLKTPKKIEISKRVTKAAPELKEEAVAEAAPKEEPKPVKKVVAKATPKKKKSTKVITNPSKKKAVAAAKPKRKVRPAPKGPTLADKLRAKAKRDALAAVEKKKQELKQRQLDKEIRESAPKDLNVTKVSYNLSKADSETMVKQSRAEYRKNNLRPNGKPYDD